MCDHTWRVVHRVVLGCRHGRRPRSAAAIRRIQNGIDRREVQFGNAGVAETNRKTFTRKPAGSERPIHPHATPQLVQSERLQVDWSRGLQDRRSTSKHHTPSHRRRTETLTSTIERRWSEMCVQLKQAAALPPRHHSFIHNGRCQ